jgi:chemotaxis protein methyltransferase CheR
MPPAPKARTLSAEIAAAREPMSAASELLERGRFDQATRMIEDALQRAPGNVALLLTHGNAMLMLSRFDQARSDYRRALEIEPLCAEAHLFLGIACAEGGAEMHAEAAREVGRAIFLDPHLPLAHYFAGRLAEQAGDRVGARRAYRNAIDASRKGREVGPLMSVMPDLPADPAMLARAARYALAALEEHAGST